MRPKTTSFLAAVAVVLLAAMAGAEARRGRSRGQVALAGEGKAEEQVQAVGGKKRDGKLFSLFNVVSFRNDPCASTESISGSRNRNGTCLTSSECSDRGGTVSGNCAASFGVCCVFILSDTSGDITQNCTYLQNVGFPSALSGTDSVTYTVRKCNNDVCDLRLDFETFTTVGPGDTLETNGGVCPDTFVVTTNTAMTIPTICGANSGQHMYVNIGNQESDTATLAFTFSGTSTTRMYDIKITQVDCNSQLTSPDTCLQYHVGFTGTIKTFNFDATDETHLRNQAYSICIRPEEGFCCIEYFPCQGLTDAFSPNPINPAGAQTDNQCTEDFVVIEGGMAVCTQGGTNGPLVSRLCGQQFNPIQSQDADTQVCDCIPPFVVGVNFDNTDDAAGAGNTITTHSSRGACLTYMQIPCA